MFSKKVAICALILLSQMSSKVEGQRFLDQKEKESSKNETKEIQKMEETEKDTATSTVITIRKGDTDITIFSSPS